MTILQALQEANDEAHIPKLAFANLKEFNAFVDSFRFEQFPVNVIVPFDSNGTHLSGRRKATLPLQGWVLTRIAGETMDYRSVEVEHDYIGPMRALAAQFIGKLLDTDIIDQEVFGVSDTIRPAYQFTAHNLFGVSYTCNIPILEDVC